jgi:polysaccharide export outer membrane protein
MSRTNTERGKPLVGVTSLWMRWSILLLPAVFASCLGSKPVQYFDQRVDTSRIQEYRIPDPVIEKGDILNIVIYSDNPEATMIFNQAGTSGTEFASQSITDPNRTPGAKSNQSSTSYLVDNRGMIRMHAIGEIEVEGLTRQQLQAIVTERITALGVLMKPYCTVRFLNFKITVLGEVSRPGIFTVPVEKATILEVMSMAGEVNLSGRRDKITLVRETMGKRSFAKLNLADPAIFQSPYFYLKQNDVVIVNSDERKFTPTDQQNFQVFNIALSLLSILIVLITVL